eukprot:scaffold1291_cov136-Amphora_coffeaeformis.AAC.1
MEMIFLVISLVAFSCEALSVIPTDLRDFLASSVVSSLLSTDANNPVPLAAGSSREFKDIVSELDAPKVQWNPADSSPVDWSKIRYGSSTLSGSRAPPASAPTRFPDWITNSGDDFSSEFTYWLSTFRFRKASFPLGRDKLSPRVPGAGLATCVVIPNVGYNPAPFTLRFSKLGYEDHAYNVPRRLEAFWPQAKVTAIQQAFNNELSPRCFVTGEGCSKVENPYLHVPSSRFVMDFTGPTRSGPSRSQTMDVTILQSQSADCSIEERDRNSQFMISRQYVQFNIQQELQCQFKEVLQLSSSEFSRGGPSGVNGRLRVAAFQPARESDANAAYDDNMALALYDYDLKLKSIGEEEALQI